MAAIQKMVCEELVRGLPKIGENGNICDACQAGKQRRAPFLSEGQFRAKQVLEVVHGDLCGPVTPSSNKYFLLLVDDCRHYMWLAAIPSKNCAAAVIHSSNKYFLLLVDDCRHYMWLAAIPSKNCAAAAIHSIQAQAKAEAMMKLHTL
jgi:hypothetical protein